MAEMDAGLPKINVCYIYRVPWYCAKSLYRHQSFNLPTTPLCWCYIILILQMKEIRYRLRNLTKGILLESDIVQICLTQVFTFLTTALRDQMVDKVYLDLNIFSTVPYYMS